MGVFGDELVRSLLLPSGVMPPPLKIVCTAVAVGVLLRNLTLVVSIRNERRLKAKGAAEFGRATSYGLFMAHGAFYISAVAEAIHWRYSTLSSSLGVSAVAGIVTYIFSFLALFYVIYALHPLWTVKIIIAPNHPLVTSFLFRHIRHPCYYLNLLPELVGLTLFTQAWLSASLLLPLYVALLSLRIREEERVLRKACPKY